jgi:hypothetical protein
MGPIYEQPDRAGNLLKPLSRKKERAGFRPLFPIAFVDFN